MGSPEHRRLRDIGVEAFKTPSANGETACIKEMAEWH